MCYNNMRDLCTCRICGVKSVSVDSAKIHMRLAHHIKFIQCSKCSFITRRKPALKAHEINIHQQQKKKIYQQRRKEENTYNKKETSFFCQVCGRTFTDIIEINKHIWTHIKRGIYITRQKNIIQLYICFSHLL